MIRRKIVLGCDYGLCVCDGIVKMFCPAENALNKPDVVEKIDNYIPFEEERDTITATEGLTGIELPGCFYPKLITLTLPTDP